MLIQNVMQADKKVKNLIKNEYFYVPKMGHGGKFMYRFWDEGTF